MAKKKFKKLFSFKLTVLYALLLAVLTTLLLSKNPVYGERLVFSIFYAVPVSWHTVVINITHFGSTAALYSMVFILFVVGHKKISTILLANGVMAFMLAWVLKELVMRPRPAQLWVGVKAYEWGPISYGYPSGHTAIIVAIAATLWPVVAKPYRYVLAAMVVAVATSRMSLGMHAPLDILGGSVIGLLVVQISNLVRDFARNR